MSGVDHLLYSFNQIKKLTKTSSGQPKASRFLLEQKYAPLLSAADVGVKGVTIKGSVYLKNTIYSLQVHLIPLRVFQHDAQKAYKLILLFNEISR
ncbi:MAG: hypothetical protein COC09_04860 [Gammaproteobacteria bacterium]|nr:MAG: hypothetical protein COC09_04860 [Gammaproteobacteria bacterium]